MTYTFTEERIFVMIRTFLNLSDTDVITIVGAEHTGNWVFVPSTYHEDHCPDTSAKIIDVRTRGGEVYECLSQEEATGSWWDQAEHNLDIIAHRVVSY